MEGGVMKRVIVFVSVLCFLFGAGGGAVFAADFGPFVRALPQDTEVFLQIPSIETIYSNLAITKDSAFGEPVPDLEQAKKAFGFNPLDIAELKGNGIDTGKPIYISLSDIQIDMEKDEPVMNLLVSLPVIDAAKVLGKFKQLVLAETPNAEFTEEGGITRFKSAQNVDFYLAEKGGYLLMAGNPKSDVKELVKSILAGGPSLTKTEKFTQATADMSAAGDMFAYVNIESLMVDNQAAIEKLYADSPGAVMFPFMKDFQQMNMEFLSSYKDLAISAAFTGKDFTIDTVLTFKPDSKAKELLTGVNFNKTPLLSISEPPVLFWSVGFDLNTYYKTLVASLSPENSQQLNGMMANVKQTYGFDLEADVIDNLAGNLNIGIYDGMTINMTNYNTLMSINVKDQNKTMQVIDKFIAKLPPEQQQMVSKIEVAGNQTYAVNLAGMAQLFIGAKNNSLILSVTKSLYEKALAADTGAGFVKKIGDKALVQSLTGDVNVFYLNINELYKALKNFQMFFQQFTQGQPIDPIVSDAVNKFQYLITSSRVEGNSVRGEMVLKTNFDKPFFQGVFQVTQNLKKKFAESMQPPGGAPESAPKTQ
jgi:hypothetical protein